MFGINLLKSKGSKIFETKRLLSDIKITKAFKRCLPQSWKILRQLEHYKQYGKFDNKIIVDEKMYLRDGYTQYLVAKMLGITNVTVYTKVN